MDIVDIDRNDVIDGPSDVIHHGVLDHEKGLLIAASKRHESANVDEFLLLTGEYGRGQKCLTFFLCLFMFGATYNILSTVFVTLNSSWRCSAYGVTQGACLYNGTIDENHELYEKRCEMNRTSWEFEREAGYSIVTEVSIFVVTKTLVKAFFHILVQIQVFLFKDKTQLSQVMWIKTLAFLLCLTKSKVDVFCFLYLFSLF